MKNRKLFFLIFTLICFIAIGVSLIVDVAINKQVTWAMYPLISVVFGWALLSSLLAKKHGIFLSLTSLTLLILPYLYFLSQITPVTDWFIPVGLPSAIAGIVAIWILFLLFRFTKINIWYKSAITVFILCVGISPAFNYFMDIYMGYEPFTLDRVISVFSCIIVTAVIGIVGYIKSNNSAKN